MSIQPPLSEASSASTRSADAKDASGRWRALSLSTNATRTGSDIERALAMFSKRAQNGRSSATEVRCPARRIDRFSRRPESGVIAVSALVLDEQSVTFLTFYRRRPVPNEQRRGRDRSPAARLAARRPKARRHVNAETAPGRLRRQNLGPRLTPIGARRSRPVV